MPAWVRDTIRLRSNSLSPANTVKSNLPCAVVVSHQRVKVSTSFGDRVDRTQQMQGRERQPVEASDDDNIAALNRLHRPSKL